MKNLIVVGKVEVVKAVKVKKKSRNKYIKFRIMLIFFKIYKNKFLIIYKTLIFQCMNFRKFN